MPNALKKMDRVELINLKRLAHILRGLNAVEVETLEILLDEGKEPAHKYVATTDGECKFWLDPVRLARNKVISPIRIRSIEKLVFDNLTL